MVKMDLNSVNMEVEMTSTETVTVAKPDTEDKVITSGSFESGQTLLLLQ